MLARDLTKLPLSAWGRHELENEVRLWRERAEVVKEDQQMYDMLVNTPGTAECLELLATFRAVLREAPAELVEELRQRIAELEQTGGPCDACKGCGKHSLGLGTCEMCWGTGHRTKLIETLVQRLANAENSAQEAMKKADAHRRQRDELVSKFETTSGRRKE
jgi:hypothetical protein